ncbi:MAG: ribonuclease PH [Myxococcota bacterium]
MSSTTRTDGRSSDALRPVEVNIGFQRNPEGSVLYRCGGTTVLVSASVDEGVRDWLKGQGKGWLTGEYAMHPRANPRRQSRDGRRGRVDGRSMEIQRLIARSLRAAVRLDKLGERTITVDCDVIDADGGTRTASITAGYLAVVLALDSLRRRGLVGAGVLREPVAAVSVGFVNGGPMLDLCYVEDSAAEVDLNVVATASGAMVEVQGTAEGEPLPKPDFDRLVDLALVGVSKLVETQKTALADAGVDWKLLLG